MRKNHSKIVCIKLVHLPYLYIWCTVTLTSNLTLLSLWNIVRIEIGLACSFTLSVILSVQDASFHAKCNFEFIKISSLMSHSLWIKPTDALNFNFIGITTLYASGRLSAHHQEFLVVQSSILLLVANGHHNCIKCTKTEVRLRTPDDGQKGCPKHVES